MAWNPAPEVQVARDAATRLGQLAKSTVRKVVILYTTQDDRIGTVSFGQTKVECSQAKLLSDKLYAEAIAHFEDYQ